MARDLAPRGISAEVVCTDGFLRTNADLGAAGLKMRKGFPESFDGDLLMSALARLRAGDVPVEIPEYSHLVYDRVPGAGRLVGLVGVVVVEGVNALQPPVAGCLDLAIYLDAEEPLLRDWFTSRFLVLCAEADADPDGGSFYGAFREYDAEKRRSIATRTWNEVNGVNLRDHIGPSRAHATYVVVKNADHSIKSVTAAT